jgi:ketosteroid isomerase-like protein
MPPKLPDTLRRYFAAQNRHDPEGMTDCFAPDAEVRDEGGTYVGREAIRQWKVETIAKYGISIEPLTATDRADELTVTARVAGNFPGSPADLTYDFGVDGSGLIRRLAIH